MSYFMLISTYIFYIIRKIVNYYGTNLTFYFDFNNCFDKNSAKNILISNF